jgi:hypothetical protein
MVEATLWTKVRYVPVIVNIRRVIGESNCLCVSVEPCAVSPCAAFAMCEYIHFCLFPFRAHRPWGPSHLHPLSGKVGAAKYAASECVPIITNRLRSVFDFHRAGGPTWVPCRFYRRSPLVDNIPAQEFIVERPTNFFPADAFFFRR